MSDRLSDCPRIFPGRDPGGDKKKSRPGSRYVGPLHWSAWLSFIFHTPVSELLGRRYCAPGDDSFLPTGGKHKLHFASILRGLWIWRTTFSATIYRPATTRLCFYALSHILYFCAFILFLRDNFKLIYDILTRHSVDHLVVLLAVQQADYDVFLHTNRIVKIRR